MNFIEQWRAESIDSISEFAGLLTTNPKVDFRYGLMATAVLWPTRERIEEDDVIDAIRSIAGAYAEHVLVRVQHWSEDRLEAARSLANEASKRPELKSALDSLIADFKAAQHFAEELHLLYQQELDKSVTIDQIQAALVNVGGIVSIDSLNVQITQPIEIPKPPEPIPPPEIADFVGREEELAYYTEKLRSNHLAIISGGAGVGKTFLAARLASYVAQDKNTFWHTFHTGEDFESIIWQLAGFLARHNQDELWRMLQSFRQTSGRLPPSETLFNYFLQEARNRDYVLCFDDFHHVARDPVLVQLVERILGVVTAGELDVILTSRQLPSFVQSEQFNALEGLNLPDTHQLLEIGGINLPDNLVKDLHNRTGGNAQLLILAIDALQRTEDPDSLIEQLAESSNIGRYLLTELNENLTGKERQAMNAIAVLLGDFASRPTLESILSGVSLLEELLQLTDRHILVVRGEGKAREYSLHGILQNFYYELMDLNRRQNLHERAANFYEVKEQNFIKAIRHFKQANKYSRVVDLADEHTIALMNLGHAQQLFQILEDLPERELNKTQQATINVFKGELSARTGKLLEAPKYFRKARRELRTLPRTPSIDEMEARACRGMGTLLQFEDPEEALKWFERGLKALDSLPGSQQIPAFHIYIGSVQALQGNYEEAKQAILKGQKRLPPGPSLPLIDAMLGLGVIYTDQGEVEEAYQHVKQALELAQELNALFHILNIRDQLGILLYYQGSWKASIAEGYQALELAGRLGDIPAKTRLLLNLGSTYTSIGNDSKALEYLRAGLDLARQYNLTEFEVVAQANLADLYVRRNEFDAAIPLLGEARHLAHEMELSYQLPEIYRNWALVHLNNENHQAALDAIQQSLKIARQLEAKLEVGMSLRTLADVRLAMSAPLNEILLLYGESINNLAENAYEAARTEVRWGQVLLEGSNPSQGKVLLRKAHALFKRLKAERDQANLDNNYPNDWFEF